MAWEYVIVTFFIGIVILQQETYIDFLHFANRLADASGDILRGYFNQPVSVESKADASPVTQADREVEQAIRSHIETNFPSHGIVGEEFGNINADSEYQWVIDPIDGTRAFMAGFPTFTTLIALLHNGKPVIGVIDQPILRDRFVGVSGKPSTLNGKEIKTRATSSQIVIGTTSAPYHFSVEEALAFERVRKITTHTVVGGDAYGYAMLASGNLDIFMDACLKPYDFCALILVIEGAGGIITDWAGKPLTLASEGRVIACASKELHEKSLCAIGAEKVIA